MLEFPVEVSGILMWLGVIIILGTRLVGCKPFNLLGTYSAGRCQEQITVHHTSCLAQSHP